MTVAEFLVKIRRRAVEQRFGALEMIAEFLVLLDEFGEEKCSVLAGKIRAQTERFRKIETAIDGLEANGLPGEIIKRLRDWMAKEEEK